MIPAVPPTPASDSPCESCAPTLHGRRRLVGLLACGAGAPLAGGVAAGLAGALLSTPATADTRPNARGETPGVEVQTLSLRREEGLVLLDFDLRINLPAAVEEALRRGVPLYFVAQVGLFRPRWYWRDARISRVERQWRLSHQPLTGVFRVSLGSIGQNHTSLEEALAAVSRLARWQIADATQADPTERHYAEFNWRLDVSQLPRPMQFGLGGSGEWSLGVERTLRLEP